MDTILAALERGELKDGYCYTAEDGVTEMVKVVEVPVIEEVIVKIPKKEVVKKIREVPRVQYEQREVILEVPEVRKVYRDEPIVTIEEVIKEVPIVKRVEVPKEKIVYEPVIHVKEVEQRVEVDGGIVEVPYEVEKILTRIEPNYIDNKVETVVGQTVTPHVRQSKSDKLHATCIAWEPKVELYPVWVPKPIRREPKLKNAKHYLKLVDVPVEHYNGLLKVANPKLPDEEISIAALKDRNGDVRFLSGVQIVPPMHEIDNKRVKFINA